ncbi:ninG domain protein, partial [Escherichia coli EC1847]
MLIEFRVPGSTTTDLRMPGETIPYRFCISFALV